jgi:hypothetical protein
MNSAILEPNFFIIGAPKAGTSALHEYLSTHPNIFMTELKEPHHYSTDLPGRGVFDRDEYLAMFARAQPQHLVRGESSVYYMYSQVALPRILETYPEAQFVAMLRNPIELVSSLHAQLLLNLNENVADFATAWRLQEERAAGRRLPPECMEPTYVQYAQVAKLGQQLERALAVAGRERVYTILFDDFRRNPAQVYAGVLEFLGLPHDGRTAFPQVNARTALRSTFFRRLLNERRIPACCKRWARKVGLHRVHDMLKSWNEVRIARTKLDPGFQQELIATFRDDVLLLSELLKRDLSYWLAVPR